MIYLVYGEVEPGDYRLAQPVILPDGSDYTLYAEFTVESRPPKGSPWKGSLFRCGGA